MSARAAQLAEQFERANQEVIALVNACTDEDWQRPTVAAGRTIGVTAHHIAIAYPLEIQGIQAIADGHDVPITMDEVNAFNARHLMQHAACTRAAVLDLLDSNGAVAAEAVRALSDAQLDRSGVLLYVSEQPKSVRWLVEHLLVGHVGWHLDDINAALGDGT